MKGGYPCTGQKRSQSLRESLGGEGITPFNDAREGWTQATTLKISEYT